ncbi:MAG: branched-chain amino acid ABC transporter permease [Christensenellales bacterium]
MAKLWKKHKISIIAIVLLLTCCFLIAQRNYPALILALIAIYAIANTGLDILFGYSGQISFGHAGFFAFGSYTSAILAVKCGIDPILGILAGCIVSTCFGIVLAFPASKLVKHFLSLMTIAFGQMVYMFVNSTTELTGGAGGIKSIPPITIFGWVLDTNIENLAFGIIVLGIVLLVKRNIIHSRTGRAFIAIRENVHAAQGLGIHVRNYKIMAFAISAFIAGLAGGLYAHLVGFISPETYNATQSTLFMTMILFGGISTMTGPLVGAAILLVAKEILQSFSTFQILVYGVFILIVLFFFPSGVVGVFSNARKKIAAYIERRKKNAEA